MAFIVSSSLYLAIWGLCFALATTITTAKITCGPRGAITMAGSPSGVSLAMAWANAYTQVCRNTSISIKSSNSIVGAQRVCAMSSAGSAVDVGIRSRPLQSNEATTSNGYNFMCAQGNVKRTTIQVKVALDAFVLVVAPDGGAAYCIQQLLGNGLTLEHIRILFSNYTPAQILDIPTPSPSFSQFTPPPASVSPTVSQPVTPPDGPPPVKPSKPFRPVAPTRKPVRPTARPTFPTPTIKVWSLRFPHSQTRAGVLSDESFCNNLQALVAGPPRTSEVHQDFAKSILLDSREGITPLFFSGSDEEIVSYLQENTNAIAFLPLHGYVAFQNRLQLVNVKDVGGNNRAPNSTTLTAKLYPLSYDLYMQVRSDDSATLAKLSPFFTFAYSSQGCIEVASAGLVPLTNPTRVQMLSKLIPAKVPKPVVPPTYKPVVPPTYKPVVPPTYKPIATPISRPTLPQVPVASSLRVPITVKKGGTLTKGFPCQVVVPLPRGLVFNKDLLGLLGVPSQVKVLELWPNDGSIRHVQVLFIVEPSTPSVLALADTGVYPAPSSPVRVTEDSLRITVDTGKVRFTVKKTNFNLFDDVWVDYNADGVYADSEKIVVSNSTNGGVLVDYLNRVQLDSSRSDVVVTIEESGPMRVVIRAEAYTRFESTTNHIHGFAVRIYAYAGQENVQVDYQLQNSASVVRAWPLYFHEMNLNLNLKLATSTPTLTFGATDGSTITTSSPAFMAQDMHNAYSIYSGGGSIIKQKKDLAYENIKRQTGFVHIRDGSQGPSVTVVGRNFWQMWPNGLSVKGKQLSVQLFPSWSAQWEGAIPNGRSGRISPTGLYWLKDMQHVYKSVLFAFHATIPSTGTLVELANNFQYGPVASVLPDWYGQTRATLDLGGYVPPKIVLPAGTDTVSPDSHLQWGLDPTDQYYRANVRNFGDPEGPYRAHSYTSGGWPYPSNTYHASGYVSDYYVLELWGIGEANVRPQWLAGYQYSTDQATLKLTETPYAGGSWRIFVSHSVSKYAAPFLANTEEVEPDYFARDDWHGWFYHAMDAYFVTGNPWIKDWYTFVHEFRMVRLNQGDTFPDLSSSAQGHSLAHAIQAGRVTGASDVLPAFRNYLITYLIPNQDPKYGQQYKSIEGNGGGFQIGYLMRTMIAYMEEARAIDPQGFAEAFNYLSGLMAWNLNYGNFAYEFDAAGSVGTVGQSNGLGLTLVDPQAWYYWNTGKKEYWNQIVDFIDGGINGGQPPYGNWILGWGGLFEGRLYHYVLQTPRGSLTAPAAISDLVASRDESWQVIAQWTTPVGANRFHLVWSEDVPISEQHTTADTKRNWWACTAVGTSLVAVPRSKQTIRFNAPTAKYVAMFVFDVSNNMSRMSHVAILVG